ncbi:hypothetical protein BV25DRAFT_1798625, partial [Artomyces pyxidatus]
MRLHACVPQSWWEFAVDHAVHIYNWTPLRRLNWQTLFEALTGKQTRIDHLRVFGCGAYVHLPPAVRQNKLTPNSELMTYLGVAPGGHGDRFMRSPNNVVFTSAHALFDENMFPKCAKETKRRTTRLPNSVPDSNDEPDDPH